MSEEVIELSKQQFDRVIRFVKTGGHHSVETLAVFCAQHLERLKLTSDIDHAIDGIPEGSDQCDVRSFDEWMSKITKGCKRAKLQLLQIDATVRVRLGK